MNAKRVCKKNMINRFICRTKRANTRPQPTLLPKIIPSEDCTFGDFIMLNDYFVYLPHLPSKDNLQPCPEPDMQTLQFVANATHLGNQSSVQGHYTIPVWDFLWCVFSNFCTAQVCTSVQTQMNFEVLRLFMSLLTAGLIDSLWFLFNGLSVV